MRIASYSMLTGSITFRSLSFRTTTPFTVLIARHLARFFFGYKLQGIYGTLPCPAREEEGDQHPAGEEESDQHPAGEEEGGQRPAGEEEEDDQHPANIDEHLEN